MDKVKLKGSVAYVYKVFIESLKKAGIETVSGALSENAVVVGVPFNKFTELITAEINNDVWEQED
jgi:hypothetical protein